MAPRRAGHLHRSDLRGLTRLATQATVGVARIVEGVHQAVLGTLGLPGRSADQAGGLTGLVYRGVGGITRGIGGGIEAALLRIEPLLGEPGAADQAGSERREAVLSALNGVVGDRLERDRSPFAIKMSLRRQGSELDLTAPLQIDAASRRIVLLVHGLCMNDRQWQAMPAADGHNHGRFIARQLGHDDLYLRYNSGRPVGDNGQDLARLLERLLQVWPVPVDQLVIVAHSMGGLVTRAALHWARLDGMAWPRRLGHVVFLGTPHHGAPLERAGHGVDLILAGSRWTAPFARLAGLRSAGITDLRHGNLFDREGSARDRGADQRSPLPLPLPLPAGTQWHTVAATTAARRGALADRLIGDGLVPLHSALGIHREAARSLAFGSASTLISYRTGHLELLRRPAIAEQIVRWTR